MKIPISSVLPAIEAVGLLILVGYLFYDNMLVGAVFFPYVFFHIKKKKREYEEKRKVHMAQSFKDGMQAALSALCVGYSLENAFREALSELEIMHGKKDEIYKGFAEIVRKLSINVNIEEAFMEFAKECDVEEILDFAEILGYAKRSGGNLIQIIQDTTNTISDKIDVSREINTILSAKRLESRIMNAVPFAIIFYMRLTSPELFVRLYHNTAGIAIMSVCLAFYIGAKLLSDRIVNIRI